MGRKDYSERPEDGSHQVREVPLTEHDPLPCLFVAGTGVEAEYGAIHLISWNHIPSISGETAERRIVARLALSPSTARELLAQLQDVLLRGSPH